MQPRRNKLESASPNYLQRDDPFFRTCMVRSPRAKTKHKKEAIIEINRNVNIIIKYSWWEVGLPDLSLIFATAPLIWDEAFNVSEQNLLAYNVHTSSVGRSVVKKQESKACCFLYA